MSYSNRLILLFIFASCGLPTISWANLLIHPNSINFQVNERSQVITLANTSDRMTTYQLQWKENIALPAGGYRVMQESEKTTFMLASPYIRFSPRQVTLGPRERQSVKLLLRRVRNLQDGEYRSHLLFKAMPSDVSESAEPIKNPTMNISMVLNFSIPVALRVGDYDAQVTVKQPEIQYDPIRNTGAVFLSLERRGIHSAFGDISAFWKPKGGTEYLLAKSANHSLWTELNQYRHRLSWAASDFTPQNGELRIHYQGVKLFRDLDYVNQTFDYKQSNISVLPSANSSLD